MSPDSEQKQYANQELVEVHKRLKQAIIGGSAIDDELLANAGSEAHVPNPLAYCLKTFAQQRRLPVLDALFVNLRVYIHQREQSGQALTLPTGYSCKQFTT